MLLAIIQHCPTAFAPRSRCLDWLSCVSSKPGARHQVSLLSDSRPGHHSPRPSHLLACTSLRNVAFFGNQQSVKSLIHLFQFAPLKSGIATSIWRQEGYMAPKPKPARLVFAVGMALIVLGVMTWALAAPSTSPIYHPQLLLLY